ncbi:MAG: hypothetical protein LBE12_08855, partial [Planctomycetaceae bacterium]|nr:hypothetical protein [Planctomycetaceae bacterium]
KNALKSYHGIDCQIAKLSPKELCQLLKDDQTVVILALRRKYSVLVLVHRQPLNTLSILEFRLQDQPPQWQHAMVS